MKKKQLFIILGVACLLVAGIAFIALRVSGKNKASSSAAIIGGADGPTAIFLAGKLPASAPAAAYRSITMEEAGEVFAEEGDYIILDVRRADEYAGGHIPGALNLANEDIGSEEPDLLPDKEQTIYVYCRSGNRSKKASKKLAAMGYTNIIECGGITDWTGELEK